MLFKPKDPQPLLIIKRSIGIPLAVCMIISVIGTIIFIINIWKDDKASQLFILLGSITAYFFLFLFIYLVLQHFANKYPVIRCFDTYLETDKKIRLTYEQIFEISRVVRIYNKHEEEFLYISYRNEAHIETLSFYETSLDCGYLALKRLLGNIHSTSHITFKSEESDNRWWI